MRSFRFAVAMAATLALSACNQGENATPNAGSKVQGRYVGIGIYEPGPLWSLLVVKSPHKDPARAVLHDDQRVIVTVDSQTGEVRQCGNFSGYCIRMNPWQGPLAEDQSAPLPLAEHAADLERKAQEEESSGSTAGKR